MLSLSPIDAEHNHTVEPCPVELPKPPHQRLMHPDLHERVAPPPHCKRTTTTLGCFSAGNAQAIMIVPCDQRCESLELRYMQL